MDVLHLWEMLYNFELEPDVEDVHIWRLSNSGQYSAKSAYEGFFMGSTQFGLYERIWRTWAPPKCRFFLWLVAHNRSWTADRLARRGLPHPEQCPLCDQEDETINHLLVSCVFARQFWYHFFRQVGLHSLSPQPSDTSFDSRWEQAIGATSRLVQKGLNSHCAWGMDSLEPSELLRFLWYCLQSWWCTYPCWRRAPAMESSRS